MAMIAVLTEDQAKSPVSEIETLKQFVEGDLSAFEIIFHKHQSQIYGWIVRIVRDASTAEDLVIETFWRIYRARKRFDPERSFEAWARTIATHVAIDALKTLRPEETLMTEPACTADKKTDWQQHIRQQTERAFRQLPARLQGTAMLALVEEVPYEEISKDLGISVGAVKSRVFRAVRLLRKMLRKLGVEP
jgi:RNA polymerase sigma factor (sigma-70 family)